MHHSHSSVILCLHQPQWQAMPEDAHANELSGATPKSFRLKNHGGRDVVFTGEEVASVRTSPIDDKAIRFALYRTAGGRLIGQKIGVTISEVEVFNNSADVVDFFGQTPASQALYGKAGLTDSVRH